MNNWQTKKLGEICDFLFGYPFKANDFNGEKRGVPVIRIGDIGKNSTDKYYDKSFDRKYLVNQNDILIGLSGSIKVNKWNGPSALLNQRIVKLNNFKPGIVEEFVFYQLPMALSHLEKQLTQGTVKNVLISHLLNIRIIIPPLSIQQQIVERLDAIRKLQELNNKEIEKAEELFDSYLVQQFTHNKKLVTKKIGEVTESISYGLSTSVAGNLDENGTPILTMAEVNDDGSISYLRIRKIKVGEKERNKFLLSKGDVLFNWRNASKKLIGKTVIFESDRPTIYASFLLKVVPKAELSNYYLAYYLNFLRRSNYFSNYCKEQANNTVNASELRTIDIHYPPLAEQKKIVDELFAIQKYKEQLLLQKEAVTSFFESTLNKAMKGELVQ